MSKLNNIVKPENIISGIRFKHFSNLPLTKKLDYTNDIATIYKRVLDKETGMLKLVVKEKYNIREQIQSYKDDVDIYKLISKYENGDVNALDRVKPFYADVSNVPSNLIDIQNSMSKFESVFNSLDKEKLKENGITNLKEFINSIYENTLKLGEKDNEKNNIKDNKVSSVGSPTSTIPVSKESNGETKSGVKGESGKGENK